MFKLCQLVLTIPATRASVERSFSENRLSNLAVLSIEKECINKLSQGPTFYDDVIEKFASDYRRIQLHYKQ